MPRAPSTRILADKVPPNYGERVLARVLPSASVLSKLSREALTKLSLEKDHILKEIEANPLSYFQPLSGGQGRFLTSWDREPEVVCLINCSGNKGGKTTGGTILLGECLLGKNLWGFENRPERNSRTPVRACVFAEDFDSHTQTIAPNLFSWLPKGAIRKTDFNNLGHVVNMHFTNGSILHFKTYAQGIDTAEGKDWDFVWFDEPPPRELYTAAFRGLVTKNGRMVVTATLLKEVWLFDEGEKGSVRCFTSTIHDNTWLSPTAKAAFLEALPDEERETRESGKPMNLSGLVYKSFADRDPYVIEQGALPLNAPYILGVDPHERKPVYVAFAYLTPNDEVVWFDYLKVKGSLAEIFETLGERCSKLPRPPSLVVMDPNRGPARQIDGQSWQGAFELEGYDVLLANDDINFGHSAMYEMLKVDKRTGTPKMMWTTGCRGAGGPVWQMLRYSWDEWATGRMRSSRDVKETPRQHNKDFPDIHRYVAMAKLSYSNLVRGYEVLERATSWKGYGNISAHRQ